MDLEGQSLKLSAIAAFLKRVSLLIRGAKHVDWEARPLLGAGPAAAILFIALNSHAPD